MDVIRRYLLTVTAAALICGLVKSLLDDKTSGGRMVQLVCGILMTVTVLSPVLKLKINALPAFSEDIATQAGAFSQDGATSAQQAQTEIINRYLESYILDKAAVFGIVPEVEFLPGENGALLPSGVILRGTVPPYAKTQLQQQIEEDLGIAKEDQQWIG